MIRMPLSIEAIQATQNQNSHFSQVVQASCSNHFRVKKKEFYKTTFKRIKNEALKNWELREL